MTSSDLEPWFHRPVQIEIDFQHYIWLTEEFGKVREVHRGVKCRNLENPPAMCPLCQAKFGDPKYNLNLTARISGYQID